MLTEVQKLNIITHALICEVYGVDIENAVDLARTIIHNLDNEKIPVWYADDSDLYDRFKELTE